MLLLSISTSTPMASVALGYDGNNLAHAALGRPRAHDEFLTPAIEFCAGQACVDLDHLAGVIVDRGPGLFTGLRVGIATAKAIALSLQIPMYPVSSLDLLALGARHARREICAVIDARRGEVYSALYTPAPGGVVRTSDYRVHTASALADELLAGRQDVIVVGDGGLRYADELHDLGGVALGDAALAYPWAETALELGAHHFVQEEFVAPHAVEPLYLRKSDAEIKWADRREGRGMPL